MGSSSSSNTLILFLFSVALLYRHIRTNETNGEKLSNEKANILKGMIDEAFAINFSQENLRFLGSTQTNLIKSFHYRRKDDSGCESDVSSNNSSDETPIGVPGNKRRKKYAKNKECDMSAIR